jgi:hypothetical protein
LKHLDGDMSVIRKGFLSLMLVLIMTGCIVHTSPSQLAKERATQEAGPLVTPTAFQPLFPTATRTMQPTQRATEAPIADPAVWFDESLPELLRQQIQFKAQFKIALSSEESDLRIGVVPSDQGTAAWVFAVVAPFPTVLDEVSREDLRRAWRGEAVEALNGSPLMMSPGTKAAFEGVWGPASEKGVLTVGEQDLLTRAWQERPSWALVPFEKLEPRWKVLRVDGVSPLDKAFSAGRYPLVVRFGVTEAEKAGTAIMPETNRDPLRMTVVVLTGVTALTRSTGWHMEQFGMTFPGKDIWPWLREADITHISNEVPFTSSCHPANPFQTTLIFCSRPEYIELLNYIGTDVVELTGNHLMDWGEAALEYTLELLEEQGMYYYAAGRNQEEARAPLLMEHNGNKIAFIGCNPYGPAGVWATGNRVGVANCTDYGWVEAEIQKQVENGYIPIVTLQHHEIYSAKPSPLAERDFLPLSEAGAVIVSGSQAHHPHGMTFVGDRLVHYGLGNLFFDQMETPGGPPFFNADELPIAGVRLQFIDRHVLYAGRHISTELLTAVLEDYSRPRPMTEEERRIFLRDIFQASGW